MRDVIVIGFMIAAVLILLRVILGSPLVARVRESFANVPTLVNTATECPAGMTFAMHDGKAYCHNGDAATFVRSLKGRMGPVHTNSVTFCALGPSVKGVTNCSGLLSDYMNNTATTVCPKDKPTYVKGPAGGKCCSGPANSTHTECMGGESCTVITSGDEFLDEKSCQFLKAQESVVCPAGYDPTLWKNKGPTGKSSLPVCSSLGQGMCFTPAILQRLNELKYDTTGWPTCR